MLSNILLVCSTLVSCSVLDNLYDNFNDDYRFHSLLSFGKKGENRCEIKPRNCHIKTCTVYDMLDRRAHNSKLLHQAQCAIVEDICISKSDISMKRYVDRTIAFIEKDLMSNSCKKTKKELREYIEKAKFILKTIYCSLKGTPNELALFTASALHNTSNFNVLIETVGRTFTRGQYCARGLLAISLKENYELLDKVSRNKHTMKYTTCPEELGTYSRQAIEDTVKFWKHMMRSCHKMTFKTMMEAFKPLEWIYRKDTVGENTRYNNREEIYRRLLKLYKK